MSAVILPKVICRLYTRYLPRRSSGGTIAREMVPNDALVVSEGGRTR